MYAVAVVPFSIIAAATQAPVRSPLKRCSRAARRSLSLMPNAGIAESMAAVRASRDVLMRAPYKEKVPAGEAGTKCLGSLGVGSGHHSPVVKGFRLSTGLPAVRRHRPHLPGCAGFGAHVADARTVEIGPGLLAAGEASLKVETVAFPGGRLCHGVAGRG